MDQKNPNRAHKVRYEDGSVIQEIVTEGNHGSALEELGQIERFTLVDEVGPDVLIVRVALLDVVSFVPPQTTGRSEVFLSSVGEATLVVELRDSITDAILARAMDRRAAGDRSGTMSRSNSVTNTSEVRRLIRRWMSTLRERLDELGAHNSAE